MTGICAISANDPKTTSSKVEEMLLTMRMRGTITEVSEPRRGGSGSSVIGFCSERDPLSGQFHATEVAAQAIDGTIFPDKLGLTDAALVDRGPSSLFDSPGGFSFVGTIGERLVAARDPLGLKPLYWGKDQDGIYGFASLITSLKRVGIAEPKPVGPGEIIELHGSRPEVSTEHVLAKPNEIEIREEDAIARLEGLLLKAVTLMVPKSSGLAFSGGVDSALVATACKKMGLEPELVTVGMEGQAELEHAKVVAQDLGLSLTTRALNKEEVLAAAPRVADTVETKSPVTLGISLPFHFACEVTRERGLTAVVMGQLSDELFGGYARFEEMALKEDLNRVASAMWDSVIAAAEGDFAPGDKVASSFGLELRCPFAYLPLAKFALELPVRLRVNVSGGKVVRKYLLRRLAEKWGLPDYVVNRPKKAFQYSSGVQKVLAKEARRSGRRLGELLRQTTWRVPASCSLNVCEKP